MITKELLISVGCRADKAELYYAFLQECAVKYGLNTKQRVAAFLTQILHESGLLIYSKEIWGKEPTKWQLKYERDFTQPFHNKLTPKDRNYTAFNLGNNEVGDGKKFLGRGLIQITGRNNYTRASLALFSNERLIVDPTLLEQPRYAILSAFWYCFDYCKLMDEFDTVDMKDDTKRINGSTMLGLSERESLYKKLTNNL